MTRTPLALAALASTAVPGLDPVAVEAVRTDDARYDVAFVADAQDRRWVVRSPRTPSAAAELAQSAEYLRLLSRRLTAFSVPVVRGWTSLPEGGRAAVHAYVPGHHLDFGALPAGSPLAAGIGRALAALHNSDPALAEEAQLPAYSADQCRRRHVAALDRAAATGHVPAALLARWEAALEDVSLWHFAPVPVHGSLDEDDVVVVFEDEDDSSTGRITAITGWTRARVADPAEDLAEVVHRCEDQVIDTVIEAYAHARVDRPDRHLVTRARLLGELVEMTCLLEAVASEDEEWISAQVGRLEELATHVPDLPRLATTTPTPTAPAGVDDHDEPDGDPEDAAAAEAPPTADQPEKPPATAAPPEPAATDEPREPAPVVRPVVLRPLDDARFS